MKSIQNKIIFGLFIAVFINGCHTFEHQNIFLKKMKVNLNQQITEKEEVERNELDVLEKYLPQALSSDALKTAIQEIISAGEFSGMQDMGNVMKELRSKHPNAEMSEASSFVKELLS